MILVRPKYTVRPCSAAFCQWQHSGSVYCKIVIATPSVNCIELLGIFECLYTNRAVIIRALIVFYKTVYNYLLFISCKYMYKIQYVGKYNRNLELLVLAYCKLYLCFE